MASHCHIGIKVGAEKRQGLIEKLEEAGIEAENQGRSSLRLGLSLKDIQEHRDAVAEVIRTAEGWSHR